MLIIEVENLSGRGADIAGGCSEGRYRYQVKVNRHVVATGEIEHPQDAHWSLLLKTIAKHGRDQRFTDVMGVTPEEFNRQRPDKVDDLAL